MIFNWWWLVDFSILKTPYHSKRNLTKNNRGDFVIKCAANRRFPCHHFAIASIYGKHRTLYVSLDNKARCDIITSASLRINQPYKNCYWALASPHGWTPNQKMTNTCRLHIVHPLFLLPSHFRPHRSALVPWLAPPPIHPLNMCAALSWWNTT